MHNLLIFGLINANGIANTEDPGQTVPLGAVWSGSALFAQNYLSENLGSLRYLSIYTIYGHGSHLSHVTRIMFVYWFSFPCTPKLERKFGWKWPSGKAKSKFQLKSTFQFLYVNNPWTKVKKWPWPSILTFIYWISCLHLQNFGPMAAIVSEISTVFPFSYRKA